MYLDENKTATLIARSLKLDKNVVDQIIDTLGIRKNRSKHNIENGKLRFKALNFSVEQIKEVYERTLSSYKVAEELNITPYKAKATLKELGLLRNQSEAASTRNRGYVKKLCLKLNTEMIEIDRKNLYDSTNFRALKKLVIKHRNSKCENCSSINNLQIHHILPLSSNKEAFFDVDNMKVFCPKCHFKVGHNGNWTKININLITDVLIKRYNIDRERLNEETPNGDAKV